MFGSFRGYDCLTRESAAQLVTVRPKLESLDSAAHARQQEDHHGCRETNDIDKSHRCEIVYH